MEPAFEQDFPYTALIAGFAVLMVISTAIQRASRRRGRIREGQLPSDGTRVIPVEERVAGNPAWASGEIRSKGRTLVCCLWLVAIVWNLTFGFSFIKSFSNPDIKTGGVVVLGIFSVGGLVAIAFAVRFTMRLLRFGESSCRIQGKAGVIGKIMKGSIHTNNDVPAQGDYTIELQCLENYYTGTGKNRKSHARSHWKGTNVVPSGGKSTRAGIPFSFELPHYAPETGYQLSRGSVSWQLTIRAPVEGVDYSAGFVVPVFKVE